MHRLHLTTINSKNLGLRVPNLTIKLLGFWKHVHRNQQSYKAYTSNYNRDQHRTVTSQNTTLQYIVNVPVLFSLITNLKKVRTKVPLNIIY